MGVEERNKELKELKKRSKIGGGPERVEKHRKQGKLTARERIDALLDPGSFVEFDAFVTHQSCSFGMDKNKLPGDGVVTGHGTIDGRQVFIFAQDFTVFAGSVGKMHAMKICKVYDMAVKTGSPVIGIYDTGGARIQEGAESLQGFGEMFFRCSLASGVVPQLALVMGPCAGGMTYGPGLADFVFMVDKKAHMFMVGPDVIKAVQNETVSFEELGGATTHAHRSGTAHFVCEDDLDCIKRAKKLLSYLPSNNLDPCPMQKSKDDPERRDESLESIIPEDPQKPYEMIDVIKKIVDTGDYFEVQDSFAKNMTVGFARMDGSTVGIVANDPSAFAGTLDNHASIKAARFVRFCDAFNIPIISLVDVPGYLPSKEQEYEGLIRNSTKLLYAYCEATCPKITLVTRKAIGGAYCVMASKHIRTDINLAWPSAEIAVVGPEGAINIVYKQELIMADDPQVKRDELISEYRKAYASAFVAAERGYIDDIIEPKETRPRLITALHMLERKREARPARKHGNMPL
ncbi:MAG: malonate decarboxylase subunit beta [Methanomassiliicoccales archaeon PtaU1.Bin124]|nr:MAG: malonate decarboxylase subunit beta [Methanomassiliicoccales archaeon PtaU1.Bin124]